MHKNFKRFLFTNMGLVILFLFFWTPYLSANPAPIGIEIGKTTLSEIKKMYTIDKIEDYPFEGYSDNFIKPEDLDIDSLQCVIVTTNKDDIAELIILEMGKHKFKEIYDTLSSKYKEINSDIPFVGTKQVTFEKDDSYIVVYSPHMAFSMDVKYMTKGFASKLKKFIKEEEQKAKKKQQQMF